MSYHKFPKMRDIGIGDMLSIELPAHIWIGFLASYISCNEYDCANANGIVRAIQEKVTDPLYLKELQADAERAVSEQHQMMSRIIPGFPGPVVPPDPGEIDTEGK